MELRCAVAVLVMSLASVVSAAERGAVSLGDPSTRIVAGSGQLHLARRIGRELSSIAGASVPVVADSDTTIAALAEGDLILIGNLNDNRLVAWLYLQHQTFVDAAFPGAGGYFVKTLIDPIAAGGDVVLIAGSDAEGHARAAERFLALAREAGRELPPLHAVESESLPPDPPDEAGMRAELERNAANWDIAAGGATIQNAIDYGLNYHFSNRPEWARMFRETMRDYIGRARAAGDWHFAPRADTYFKLQPIVIAWDLIEDAPEFSEADRQTIRESLLDMGRYVRDLPYLTEWANPSGEPRQNHTTFATLSLEAVINYFSRRGVAEVEPWRAVTDRIFEGQLRTYRADDDAGNYYQYAPLHAFGYFMRKGDPRALRPEFIDKHGDLALTVVDNRRDEVGFGDVRGYAAWPRLAWSRPATILSVAWWAHRDPAHGWGYRWLSEGKRPSPGFQATLNTELFTAPVPADVKPPARFLGVHAIMFDRALIEFIASRVMRPEWLPREGRPYFDKLTLRPSFEPKDEYLLLDGTSALAHGHEDANAILRLTWLDRIWLADLDIIRTMPRYQNMVEVARDGRAGVLPPLAELTVRADFGSDALVRSDLRDVNGADWSRNLLWRKGEWIFVLDRLTANEAGEFDLRCRWRVLGVPALERRALTVTQPGARFIVANADASTFGWEDEEWGQTDWSRYEHADGVVRTLVQRQRGPLARGEGAAFANLLAARPGEAGLMPTLTALGEGLYAIGEGERLALAGEASDGRVVAGIRLTADLFVLEAERLMAAGVRRIARGGSGINLSAPGEIELKGAGGTLRLTAPTEVALAGDWEIEPAPAAGKLLRPGVYTLRTGRVLPSAAVFAGVAALPAAADAPTSEARAVTFGLEAAVRKELGAAVRTAKASGDGLIVGLEDGRVVRVDDAVTSLASVGAAVRALAVMTTPSLVIAGDAAGKVTAFSMAGKALWTDQYGENRSRLEEVTAIDVQRTSGSARVVVGTLGQRVRGYDAASGKRLWRTEIKYWAVTGLAAANLDDDAGEEIIVGNEYLTALDLIDDDGRVLWNAWEQTGSESRTSTEKLGTRARVVRGGELGGRTAPVIIHGTETNEIFVTEPADGAVIWKETLDGAVNDIIVADLDAGLPGNELLAASSGGGIYLFAGDGRRLWWRSPGGAVMALDLIVHPRTGRPAIAAVTREGEVAVLDARGDLLALGRGEPGLMAVAFSADGDEIITVDGAGGVTRWALRLSRSAFMPFGRSGRHQY